MVNSRRNFKPLSFKRILIIVLALSLVIFTISTVNHFGNKTPATASTPELPIDPLFVSTSIRPELKAAHKDPGSQTSAQIPNSQNIARRTAALRILASHVRALREVKAYTVKYEEKELSTKRTIITTVRFMNHPTRGTLTRTDSQESRPVKGKMRDLPPTARLHNENGNWYLHKGFAFKITNDTSEPVQIENFQVKFDENGIPVSSPSTGFDYEDVFANGRPAYLLTVDLTKTLSLLSPEIVKSLSKVPVRMITYIDKETNLSLGHKHYSSSGSLISERFCTSLTVDNDMEEDFFSIPQSMPVVMADTYGDAHMIVRKLESASK